MFKSDTFLNTPYEVIINETELQINSYRSNLNPLWKDIYRYAITKHAFYIYLSDAKAIMLPKRFFENEQQIALLEGIIKTNTNLNRYHTYTRKLKYIQWLFPVIIVLYIVFTVFVESDDTKKQNQAWSLENKDDYAGALKLYTELVASNPDDASFMISKANCEITLGMMAEAEKDCEEAIKLNPGNGRAHYVYAYALYNN